MRAPFQLPHIDSARRRQLGLGALSVASAYVAYRVGKMSAGGTKTGMGLSLALTGFTASIISAGFFGSLVFASVFLTYRVGPGGLNMSISDLTLLCAIPVAILVLDQRSRALGKLLKAVAIYEGILLIVIAVHPTTPAVIELAHRLSLMAGGLLVGAAVVRLGVLRLALRLFLLVAAVFAIAAIVSSVRSGFAPAYPLHIHKNAAGNLFAMGIIIMATLPLRNIVSRHAFFPLYLLFGLGLLATKSRGAMIAIGAVVLVLFFSKRGAGRFRIATVIGGVILVFFVVTSITHEQKVDTYKLQSVGSRERQHSEAWRVFKKYPIAGAGIRYFLNKGSTLATKGQPSSVIYETTAESGVIGAFDLLLLLGTVVVILRRLESPYGVTASAVLGVKVVHSFFDLFWVAGPFTLPWLMIGVAAALERPALPRGRAQPLPDTGQVAGAR